MEEGNQTHIRNFILLGFSTFHTFKILLLIIIFFAYLITITGNVVIILAVCLHSPMYLFLSMLSVLEIVYTSVTVPLALAHLMGANRSVSFVGCFTQLCMFHSMGLAECALLAVMAFDRYLAICKPLHYNVIMTNRLCIQLAAFPFMVGFLASLSLTVSTARITFCTSNEINHFLCDLDPLLSLACSDISFNVILKNSESICASFFPLFLILVFYANIIWVIVKIKSTKGRHKAFSTCSSHLIVVTLFYGSTGIVYLRPKDSNVNNDKMLALLYTVFTPMLNPFIYTLRNKDVKQAIMKRIIRLNMLMNTNSPI